MAVGNRKRTGRGKSRNAALRAVRGDGPRVSLYEEVTAKIISQLEAGIYPWAQPWNSAAALPGLPRNAISGRAYSGINVLILWGAVIDGGFTRLMPRFWNKTAGTARFVKNAACWLVNDKP